MRSALRRGIAEQQFVPDSVFLDEHQAVEELPGTIVQRADVGVDVGMFADRRDAFAFVWMAQMGHNNADFGKAARDFVESARQGAFQRRLGDKGGAGVQQHG